MNQNPRDDPCYDYWPDDCPDEDWDRQRCIDDDAIEPDAKPNSNDGVRNAEMDATTRCSTHRWRNLLATDQQSTDENHAQYDRRIPQDEGAEQ